MITFKQFTQWQGQYCCVKTGNLEIITTDKHLGVLCQCKACFSAEFYDPRILEEYAGNKNGAGVVGVKGMIGWLRKYDTIHNHHNNPLTLNQHHPGESAS